MNIKAKLLIDNQDQTRGGWREVFEIMMRLRRRKIIAEASFFSKLKGDGDDILTASPGPCKCD